MIPGFEVGRLTVVRHIDHSELPPEVLLSYRVQGTMYECDCACGAKAYYPEKFLARGTVKSCGCLRREILGQGKEGKEKRKRIQAIRDRIKIVQAEMTRLKKTGDFETHQEAIGKELRSLFASLKEFGLTR